MDASSWLGAVAVAAAAAPSLYCAGWKQWPYSEAIQAGDARRADRSSPRVI